MPIFEYRATDTEGKDVRGTLLSGSIARAAEELARKGFHVLQLNAAAMQDPVSVGPAAPPPTLQEQTVAAALDSIAQGPRFDSETPREQPRFEEGPRYEQIPGAPPTEERSPFMTGIIGPLFNRAPLSQLLFFFRQLATMLNAGVNMVQSLDTLSTQTLDPRLRHVVQELRGHANAGRPISVGLQRYPEMFSPMIVSLVRVGESGGFLEKSCRQIAEYLEKEIELRNLVKRVTIYPKLVVGAAIIIVLATNAILSSVGSGNKIDSLLTRPATWLILGPILIGIFLFSRIGLANPRIRYEWDGFILNIPMLGPTTGQLAMAKFGRAFGTLYAGGVHVPEAIKLAADACGNEHMRARIYPAAHILSEGGSLSEAFRSTGVLSRIVNDMVTTGETTGNVDQMLFKVADYYEDEGKTKSMQFAYALGVMALLLVGVYVAYTVISFYMGYFSGIGSAVQDV